MNLTPQQLRNAADAMDAYEAGKAIEYRRFDETEWNTTDKSQAPGYLAWMLDWAEYRPKPTPKTRPWSKPDDVPGPVCWVRDHRSQWMITTITHEGVITDGSAGIIRQWHEFEENYPEYSTDRKTWHKCEVIEQ